MADFYNLKETLKEGIKKEVDLVKALKQLPSTFRKCYLNGIETTVEICENRHQRESCKYDIDAMIRFYRNGKWSKWYPADVKNKFIPRLDVVNYVHSNKFPYIGGPYQHVGLDVGIKNMEYNEGSKYIKLLSDPEKKKLIAMYPGEDMCFDTIFVIFPIDYKPGTLNGLLVPVPPEDQGKYIAITDMNKVAEYAFTNKEEPCIENMKPVANYKPIRNSLNWTILYLPLHYKFNSGKYSGKFLFDRFAHGLTIDGDFFTWDMNSQQPDLESKRLELSDNSDPFKFLFTAKK